MRYPKDEIEVRIHGDDLAEIPMASWYMCEGCGELFMCFNALGYCIDIDCDNMDELLKQYQNMTGFECEKYRHFGNHNWSK
jgi:hypothetical protein